MDTISTATPTKLTAELPKDGLYRILSLDGGGAKGFYTLGVLKEIEGMMKCTLYKRFDLVFGTSTSAIIAALIALGYEVDEIHALYKEHVPRIMRVRSPEGKSKALEELATTVFADKKFDLVKTGIGIVTTKWVIEKPMIFKGNIAQAHGRDDSFVNCMNWILEADRSKFVCANEQYYLLYENSPVTWRDSKCTEFLTAACDLWKQW